MVLSDGMRGKQWRWIGALVLLILLMPVAFSGCGSGASFSKRSVEEEERRPPAPAVQQAVVEVLTNYENAYSVHNASGLRSILAPTVQRTGEGEDGCEHAAGPAAVLAVYEAQWAAGTGRYQFIGLSPQTVKINGQAASVNLSYRIAPASEGTVEFHLVASGKQWLITDIAASCRAAPLATPVTVPSKTTTSSETTSSQTTRAPEPASVTEDSTCSEYLHAPKQEREEVGQITTFTYNVSFETEGFCERHPSEQVKFAICEVLEGFQGISRTANGSGLPAGQLDELRERYPWCFG
jgi:hypothetical protein